MTNCETCLFKKYFLKSSLVTLLLINYFYTPPWFWLSIDYGIIHYFRKSFPLSPTSILLFFYDVKKAPYLGACGIIFSCSFWTLGLEAVWPSFYSLYIERQNARSSDLRSQIYLSPPVFYSAFFGRFKRLFLRLADNVCVVIVV